jgi:hypothetical protein
MKELALSRNTERTFQVGSPTTNNIDLERRARAIERLRNGESGISAVCDISYICGHPGITITKDHPLAVYFSAESDNPMEVLDAELLASGGEIHVGWNNGWVDSKRHTQRR